MFELCAIVGVPVLVTIVVLFKNFGVRHDEERYRRPH